MRLKISQAKLRDAFAKDLSATWEFFRKTYPNQTPYAFVLYGVEDIPQLVPQVLIEEALTQVAQRYVDQGHHDSLDEARRGLRYSVADSPLFSVFDGMLPTVDQMFEPHAEKLGETTGYKVLAKSAIAAFKRLDEQKLFGLGKQRQRLLLMIITDDAQVDWSESSVKRLNSKAAFKRYQKATKREGLYSSSDALAVSPNGKAVYAVGSRENPRGKPGSTNEFISEIVAYDVVGLRVRRRWSSDFPGHGDSGRDICCAPDGKSFVVLRCRYGPARTILMRFRADSRKPTKIRRIPGEPAQLAMAHDGSHFAVTMHDKALVVVDHQFNILYQRALPMTPAGALFLRSGELLVGGDKKILRLDAATGKTKGIIPHPGDHMSADREEKLLAVSRWFDIVGNQREKPFGLKVLSLPSFKIHRVFKIPGHQLVIPMISPDGKLLAVEAQQAKGYRRHLVVLDIATGQMLGQLKCDCHGEIGVFPDSRTLAITESCYGREPITLWRVPDNEQDGPFSRLP